MNDDELWDIWQDLSGKYRKVFNNSFNEFKQTMNELGG